MQKLVPLICFGLLSLHANANDSSYTFFLNASTDNYTPSVPTVDFFGKNWKGAKSYKEADRAYANNILEFGIDSGKYSISAFYRFDYNIKMDPEVAEYRYLFHNFRDTLGDRDFTYDFYEQRLFAYGTKLGYQFDTWQGLTVKTSLNLLASNHYELRDVRDGFINGETQLGNGFASYFFSKDRLYDFLEVDSAPTGYGASLDIDINYQSGNWHFDLSVLDIGHFIEWDDSPYAIGEANVAGFEYDEDNVLQQLPIANLDTHEGGEVKGFTFRLPLRAYFTAAYAVTDSLSVSAKAIYNEIYNSAEIAAQYQFNDDWAVGTSYNLRKRSVGIDLQYGGFYLHFEADDVDPAMANSLGLATGYRVKL